MPQLSDVEPPPPPPPPPVRAQLDPNPEAAAERFQEFTDSKPGPQISPAPQVAPREQVPSSTQYNATDTGDAIRVERSAARGARDGFTQGAGEVFAQAKADPNTGDLAATWERDFHAEHMKPGSEAHQRVFGAKPYEGSDVQTSATTTARTTSAEEAKRYLDSRRLDPRTERATRPYVHDNAVAAAVRADYRNALATNTNGQNGVTFSMGPDETITRSSAEGVIRVRPWGATHERGPGGESIYRDPQLAMTPDERAFKDDIVARYPYTPEARAYYADHVPLQIRRPETKDGGGFEIPRRDASGKSTPYTFVYGKQEEAAVHELAHAWYDHKVYDKGFDQPQQAAFRADVHRLANDDFADPHVRKIAQHFATKDPNNNTEMYASLASGSMGNLELLPQYLRPYYSDLFAAKTSAAGVE